MHQQLEKFFCFLICISTKSAKFLQANYIRRMLQVHTHLWQVHADSTGLDQVLLGLWYYRVFL